MASLLLLLYKFMIADMAIKSNAKDEPMIRYIGSEDPFYSGPFIKFYIKCIRWYLLCAARTIFLVCLMISVEYLR